MFIPYISNEYPKSESEAKVLAYQMEVSFLIKYRDSLIIFLVRE